MFEFDEVLHLRHCRFLNEPCEHLPDNDFVHAMWDDSENEWTTDDEFEGLDEGTDEETDSGFEYSDDGK